ncbi:dipeptidase [bacterium]|nr:dipeptidase [bacterium]
MTRYRIFDGHNDTILRLYRTGMTAQSFFEESKTGHLDYHRAQQGGFKAGFFALHVPNELTSDHQSKKEILRTPDGYRVDAAPAINFQDARRVTQAQIELFDGIVQAGQGRIEKMCRTEQIERFFDEDSLLMIMHFEGAEAIDRDLELLDYYYERGLRSIGLVWSRPNCFAHGTPFIFPHSPDTGPGLSQAGRKLVDKANSRGIIIDLAHINQQGFYDVAAITSAPLVVSHAGVHAICPSSRNVTDEQLELISRSGGLIGITFFTSIIRKDGELGQDCLLAEVIDHIEHAVSVAGIDHVGLGSDFDGARVPSDMGDVQGLIKLVTALQERGYSHEAIDLITYKNWLRVIEQTWIP